MAYGGQKRLMGGLTAAVAGLRLLGDQHWARRVARVELESLVQSTSGWVAVPCPRPLPPQAIQLSR